VGEVVPDDLAKEIELVRTKCRTARSLAREGMDPKADSPSKSDNFKTAVEDYIRLEQKGRKGNKAADATRSVLLTNCGDWHTRPVANIRYQEIDDLLSSIRDGDGERRPRPYLANRLYSHLKHFFAWCVKRHKLNVSPMQAMDKPWNKAKPRQRDWFKGKAGDDAIEALWKAAVEIGGVDGRYVKLMLLTGKRKTALASMQWQEINDAWFWNAPPSEVANKRLNGIPLPQLAQRILHPKQSRGRVFDGLTSLNKVQRRVRELSGITDFFWHGARHIAETKTELKILPHVRDLLFDHVPQRGSGKGYDHHTYEPEMRTAMEDWAEYVEGLVGKEGVTLLR
jgi:integrase